MSMKNQEWFTEAFEDNTAFSVKYSRKLFESTSRFQKIEVYDTRVLGKVLSLDGCFMVTEKDSFVYHEMITHPAATMAGKLHSALVIGGGDGGTITELVKYPEFNRIILCEIDEGVISACREFFPEISSGLNDPRVEIVCEDGAAYVKKFKQEFDVILVDSTDPIGPGKALYELDFYNSVKNALARGGIANFQTESPFFMAKVFSETVRNLRSVFGQESAIPNLCIIPSYPGALWSFTMCSCEPLDFSGGVSKLPAEQIKSLGYFNEETRRASYVLPNFVKKLIS